MSLPFPRLGFPLLVGALVLLAAVPLRADDEDTNNSRNSSAPPRAKVVDYYQNRVLSAVVWNPAPGPLTRLEIRLSECRLYGYQGNRLVALTTVSPGKDGHDTPLGTFPILAKDRNHKSTEYGSFVDADGRVVDSGATSKQTPPPGTHYEPAPMSFFLRLTDDGVGLHAGYVTGTRVSHGCIRMPPSFAEDLFQVVPLGTPVTIAP